MNSPVNASHASEAFQKKPSKVKLVLWILAVLILVLLVVQYFNAAKYDMLVQVVEGEQIGINPTGERLDFGDLPRGKSAVRTVTLASSGGTAAYVIVWPRGEMADFIDVNRNFFTLEPGSTQRLEFTAHVPNSASDRYYRGRVLIFQIPKFW